MGSIVSQLMFFMKWLVKGFKPGNSRWREMGSSVHPLQLNTNPDNLSTAIIDMYAKCGSIDSALEVFDQIRDKAKKVDPWNAIIYGLAMHGKAEASLRIFADLLSRKIKPDSITLIGVLSACCHAGLVEEGKNHFRSMRVTYGLEPNLKHYRCMVDLLGRAGRLNEAEELVQNMPMEADAIIWGTLLAACKMYENIEVGERAARNLARVEPSDGPGRVMLSNLYADAGRWNDAFLVRRAMHNENLARSPGYSGVVSAAEPMAPTPPVRDHCQNSSATASNATVSSLEEHCVNAVSRAREKSVNNSTLAELVTVPKITAKVEDHAEGLEDCQSISSGGKKIAE
ncbi:pentatricopeptide repeat-containing protein At5g19020, mitochondrial-like [Salvia hispanica]|uniref:pentatricopeptide repeat-containing protein At5g19020, mitochondrial-like n=1 Tax=Salvia hispanica TaxID=49212 RepID=UPI002008F713|nr:pentatricopeptide repeat-containing protein At5g19020, mitochondrial-like [Salvia hispanica]